MLEFKSKRGPIVILAKTDTGISLTFRPYGNEDEALLEGEEADRFAEKLQELWPRKTLGWKS